MNLQEWSKSRDSKKSSSQNALTNSLGWGPQVSNVFII